MQGQYNDHSIAKIDEWLERPFGVWTWVGPNNHILDWAQIVVRGILGATWVDLGLI